MALVESLLTAIVRADADALVMHVGEKPYVVASTGPIELSTHDLNLQAMAAMVAQLLPQDLQRALSEIGAVEHDLPVLIAGNEDRFTVVVARGGEDVWVEIRRHRRPLAAQSSAPDLSPTVVEAPVAAHEELDAAPSFSIPNDPTATMAPAEGGAAPVAVLASAPTRHMSEEPLDHMPLEPQTASPFSETPACQAGETTPAEDAPEVSTATSAAVLPMPRAVRLEVVPPVGLRDAAGPGEVARLLAIAAARGATALYLTTHAAPFLRVDDEVRALEGELPLSSSAVESALVEFMPPAQGDAVRRGEPTEWSTELPDVGRVRCSTFRDHRGPGAIFHLISLRPLEAETLGLTPEMQALASEAEGLVLVASPPGHGKTTLVAALVDLVNRRRQGYIITLERRVRVVHEHRSALVSQRETSGTPDATLAMARTALRENPDVLVIEDLSSVEMIELALDTAASGRLVIASLTAASVTAAFERIIDTFAAEHRDGIQRRLADLVRGAIAQVLLRPAGGRRLPARELLLPTAAVIDVLAEGKWTTLPAAIEQGRAHGLATLTETLVRMVRSGVIDVREAHRKTGERGALLEALKRENIDTSFVERVA